MNNINTEATKTLLEMVDDTEKLTEDIENLKEDFEDATYISELLPTEKVAKIFDSERKLVLDSLEKSIQQLEAFRLKSKEMAKKFID